MSGEKFRSALEIICARFNFLKKSELNQLENHENENTQLFLEIKSIKQELNDLKKQTIVQNEILKQIHPGYQFQHWEMWRWNHYDEEPSIERWRALHDAEESIVAKKKFYYLGDGVGVCYVLGRYWLFIDPSDGYHVQYLITHGYWEIACTEIIAAYVKPGMKVIDIGANVGYFTVLLADLVGNEGYVYSCEPAPKIVNLLEKTLFLNGLGVKRVSLISNPISNEEGLFVDFVSTYDTKNSYVERDSNIERPLGQAVHISRTTCLDSFIPEKTKIDFIKIDAEGEEERIWSGMARVVSENQNILILLEFNISRYFNSIDFLERILSSGFKLRYIHNNSGVKSITVDALIKTNIGEDWMLYLTRT